ncbi:MAG: NnrU family protein [Pseudomonadota bacterium]
MAWSGFSLALIAFFTSHSIPVRPPVKAWLVRRLGRRGFSLAYSALSLAMLIWLIRAADRAPHLELWLWAPWQPLVPLVVMLPVCLIIALTIARPNPFSFGGAGNDQFDPTQPGLVRWSRHPLLLALALWSGSHLVPNGDLAHAILFGLFGGFALFGMQIIDRRKRREMGARWQVLQDKMAVAPLVPGWPSWETGVRLAAGVVLYAGLIGVHAMLFGVSPLP